MDEFKNGSRAAYLKIKNGTPVAEVIEWWESLSESDFKDGVANILSNDNGRTGQNYLSLYSKVYKDE